MAVRNSKEIVIDCRDSLSNNVHQIFPCLKSVSNKPPTICKFILEYPEEVKYDCSIVEKEFNKCFKSYLSHDQGHNTDEGEDEDERINDLHRESEK